MNRKINILVLVHPGFNDIELVSTLGAIRRANALDNVSYFNPELKNARGDYQLFNLDLVNNFDISNYDAIFLPGGSSAQLLRKDQKSLDIVRQFKDSHKWVLAICDASNALFEKGVFDKDWIYSSYPLDDMKTSGKNRSNKMISLCQKSITAKCPGAALDFGLEIVRNLASKDQAETAQNGLFATYEEIKK